jgi:hypothetical protein
MHHLMGIGGTVDEIAMVTCRGGKDIQRRLRRLSADEDKPIADLVHNALIAQYGSKLSGYFFGPEHASKQQKTASKQRRERK